MFPHRNMESSREKSFYGKNITICNSSVLLKRQIMNEVYRRLIITNISKKGSKGMVCENFDGVHKGIILHMIHA